MKEQCYLDANFIVYLLVKSHPNNKDAIEKLKNLKNYSWVTSFLVLDEVLYIMNKYIKDKELICSAIKSFFTKVELEMIGLENSIPVALKYIETWKFIVLKPRDAMHFQIMKSNKVKYIVTFDKHFNLNQKELGITVV